MLKDQVVVESIQLITSETSTCKWVYFDKIYLDAATLLKIFFSSVILKEIGKLWVNSDKDILYIRHLIDLLQLFKTLIMKDFVLQQNFNLLAESFIRTRCMNLATCDMMLFPTMVLGCEIRIWVLVVVGFIETPLFIWFHCFLVVYS